MSKIKTPLTEDQTLTEDEAARYLLLQEQNAITYRNDLADRKQFRATQKRDFEKDFALRRWHIALAVVDVAAKILIAVVAVLWIIR